MKARLNKTALTIGIEFMLMVLIPLGIACGTVFGSIALCGCGTLEGGYLNDDARSITVYKQNGYTDIYEKEWNCTLYNGITLSYVAGNVKSLEEAEEIDGWTYAIALDKTLKYYGKSEELRLTVEYGERYYRIDKADDGYKETEIKETKTKKRYAGLAWVIEYDS